jgi:hypothetical protein
MTQQEPTPPNVADLFALFMEELCRAVLARGSWCGIPGPVAFLTSLLLRRWAKRIAKQFAAIDAAAMARAAPCWAHDAPVGGSASDAVGPVEPDPAPATRPGRKSARERCAAGEFSGATDAGSVGLKFVDVKSRPVERRGSVRPALGRPTRGRRPHAARRRVVAGKVVSFSGLCGLPPFRVYFITIS